MDRRSFLVGLAGTALATLPVIGAHPKQKKIDVNATLERIAACLKEQLLVESADVDPAKNPTHGLVQWRWIHYRPGVDPVLIPHVERVNRELYRAMEKTHELPDAGLDAIVHEGFISECVKQQIATYREEHRAMIRAQFTTVIPFGVSDMVPSTQTVDREMNRFKNLDRAQNHIVREGDWSEQVRISPLTRFGAAYVFSCVHGGTLLASEDGEIVENARKAVRSGDPGEYQRWVMDARDKHFVKRVRAQKSGIVHMFAGSGHDLTDDVALHNMHHDEKISHLVITVPGIVPTEKAMRELEMD